MFIADIRGALQMLKVVEDYLPQDMAITHGLTCLYPVQLKRIRVPWVLKYLKLLVKLESSIRREVVNVLISGNTSILHGCLTVCVCLSAHADG